MTSSLSAEEFKSLLANTSIGLSEISSSLCSAVTVPVDISHEWIESIDWLFISVGDCEPPRRSLWISDDLTVSEGRSVLVSISSTVEQSDEIDDDVFWLWMSGLDRLGDTESSKSIDLILLDRKLLLKNKIYKLYHGDFFHNCLSVLPWTRTNGTIFARASYSRFYSRFKVFVSKNIKLILCFGNHFI